MRGIVLDQGEEYYTNLRRVFKAINNIHKEYNWLVTDWCAYTENENINNLMSREYYFLSGSELDNIINEEEFQLIWGTLSGFNKNITLDNILKYKLPFAEDNKGIWKNKVSVQHPLSEIEIIAWDSDKTILISKNERVLNDFKNGFPLSKEIIEYNDIWNKES